MSIQSDTITQFRKRYNADPTIVVRAPGRVNLVGEHTDYNDGFVLPLAIEREVVVALRPATDPARMSVYALDFDQSLTLALSAPVERGAGPVRYVTGVTRALQDRFGTVCGWEGVVAGNVPIGAGLSSSAALEMALFVAYEAVNDFALAKSDRAKLGQWVENAWLGVNSGIMDQMVVVHGQAGSAVLIDCRSLETQLVSLPTGTAVVILDTGTRRTLDGSAYNKRREQCEAGAAFFGVAALRDLTVAGFEARAAEMNPLVMRRTRHVVTENARVLAARDAARANDPAQFGALMRASHVSMRDDFEISSDALNAMVVAADAHPACYGARMTGGGFAGCAVALVQADGADDFADKVAADYAKATGNTPEVYITQPTDGAGIVG